jgi:hypothetical protein
MTLKMSFWITRRSWTGVGGACELPWQAKAAVIAVVIAACIALLPAVIGAGIIITADVVAAAGAALMAGLAEKFGIPVPGVVSDIPHLYKEDGSVVAIGIVKVRMHWFEVLISLSKRLSSLKK